MVNKHKILFLTVVEAEEFEVMTLADLVSGRNPLPSLQGAVFSLCPHRVESTRVKIPALVGSIFYSHLGSFLCHFNHVALLESVCVCFPYQVSTMVKLKLTSSMNAEYCQRQ